MGFYEWQNLTKIIYKLSSNTHFISSSSDRKDIFSHTTLIYHNLCIITVEHFLPEFHSGFVIQDSLKFRNFRIPEEL